MVCEASKAYVRSKIIANQYKEGRERVEQLKIKELGKKKRNKGKILSHY